MRGQEGDPRRVRRRERRGEREERGRRGERGERGSERTKADDKAAEKKAWHRLQGTAADVTEVTASALRPRIHLPRFYFLCTRCMRTNVEVQSITIPYHYSTLNPSNGSSNGSSSAAWPACARNAHPSRRYIPLPAATSRADVAVITTAAAPPSLGGGGGGGRSCSAFVAAGGSPPLPGTSVGGGAKDIALLRVGV